MPATPPEFAYDVFISYSHHDQTWVRDELLPGLENAGLKVCTDYRDFRVGAPVVKEMERAVLSCRHTLLVLTPAYLESAWTDFEALLIATLDPGNQKERLLPLLLKPCDLPLRIKYLGYADFTVPDDLASSWRRLLDALVVSDDSDRRVQAPRPPQYEIPEGALERYYEQIIKQYGWIRIFGQTTPKPLREVFTDVYVLNKPTAFSRFDPNALREYLWERDRGVPFRISERQPAEQLLGRGSKFFILGKPGAGKTTFLKRLAVREAQRGKWGHCIGKIPIFIPLKQFAESGKSLFDFSAEQLAVGHFPDAAPFVERLLTEGKALLLFDGLDEVAKDTEGHTNRRDQVTKQIEQFSRQYNGCHIVVTCRVAATEYVFDTAFIYLELADFAPDQVEAFVHNWFWDPTEQEKSASVAERMLAELAKPENEGIRDLARSPLLLTLLCLNYVETLSFPVRRVEFYQEALDALLKKWDASRQIQRRSLYKALSLGRKQQMFSRIAHDGFVKGEFLFAQTDLEARLKAYLAYVPEVGDAIDIDAETVLREIIEQHGIFVEQSRGLFSFAHLTFQEYYVAKYVAENLGPDTLEALTARVTYDKWREVFLLTGSLLSDATPFLAALEHALHRLITPRPRLIAWLHWIDQEARKSQAAYKVSATRSWYLATLASMADLAGHGAQPLALVGALALALAGDLADDLALAGDLSRDLTLFGDLVRAEDPAYELRLAGTLARSFAQDRASGLTVMLERIREICQCLGYSVAGEALSALVIPPAGAPEATWNKLAMDLDRIVEASGPLRSYRQLTTESGALAEGTPDRWQFDRADMEALLEHVRATQLFYDCLKLAYTPDRRAFEDRILLPPPLTKQKA
jgi:hypothetical protein